MGFGLRVGVLLLLLVAGTLSQDDLLDLSDALNDPVTTAPAVPATPPKEVPKAPEKPKTDGGDGGLDLLDAFGPDPTTPAKPKEVPKVPEKPKTDGGDGFDLGDALGPGPDPKPDKPAVNPGGGGGGGRGGGGGNFDDLDLVGGKLDPDSGHGGRGGPDPGYNPQDSADQPQEAGSGKIAGIVSAVGVALLGAASSYFAYQKKKLCFKLQGGQDPESGKVQHGQQNDPQVFSNLLRTS